MGLSQVQKQVSGLKNFVGMSVGKIWPWKKKSSLWMVSNVDPKIYVFWREKYCSMLTIFSHQKSSIFFVLMLDAVQICRIFFLLGNPPYAKKCKREPIFWLDLTFKSAIFFIFVHSIKNNKRKETILEIKCLFYCKFIYLIQFFEYKKFCNAITKPWSLKMWATTKQKSKIVWRGIKDL